VAEEDEFAEVVGPPRVSETSSRKISTERGKGDLPLIAEAGKHPNGRGKRDLWEIASASYGRLAMGIKVTDC